MALGAGLAFGLFALTFGGPRRRFWHRMTGTGLALGAFALAARPQLRRIPLGLKDILLGVGSAVGLYGIFHLGDRLSRRIIPGGGAQIEEIYALKRIRPRLELVIRLGLIIAPAEELFWRGFLQESLMKYFGRWQGTLLGVIAYGGAHLVSRNFALIGAATVAGAFWGSLYSLGAPLGALIVSHVVWDPLIFLVAPTTRLSDDESDA